MNKMYKDLMNALLKRKEELVALESHTGQDRMENLDLGHGDDMDIAESVVEQEMSMTIRNRSSREILLINEALEKMHKGSYGICENCEQDIEAKRLKARPFVKYCIDCQTEMERDNEESASGGGHSTFQFGKLE